MNAGGNAYVAYLVMQAPTSAEPPGYARGELRAARYDGTYWSSFGLPLNRNVQAPLRLPVPGATPRVTIDATGNGILAWQEPDDAFVDRIWARRLFGTNTGIATQVSPGTFERPAAAGGGRPVLARLRRASARARSPTASSRRPAARSPARGSCWRRSRRPRRRTPRPSARRGSSTAPATAAPPVAPGPPAVAVDRVGDTRPPSASPSAACSIGADDKTVRAPERLDDGRTSIAGTPGRRRRRLGRRGRRLADPARQRGRRRRHRAPRRRRAGQRRRSSAPAAGS